MLDAQHLAALYEIYSRDVYRYCYRRLHDHHAAEDCQQTVFVAVVSSMHRFEYRGREFFQAWLYSICHTVVVDYLRREARRPTVALSLDIESADLTTTALCDHAALSQALEHLTSHQRRTVLLRFVVGLSTGEIACITGRSVGAVKLLQHRALRRLHRLIEEKTTG